MECPNWSTLFISVKGFVSFVVRKKERINISKCCLPRSFVYKTVVHSSSIFLLDDKCRDITQMLLIRISLEYTCIYTFINADVISTINEE